MHLVEKWLEEMVIGTIYEGDANSGMAKSLGCKQAAESSSDYD